MKAIPAFFHGGCCHSAPSKVPHSPAWQTSAGYLAFSHHHSSPGELHPAMDAYTTRKRTRSERQKEKERWNFHDTQGWCGQPQWKFKGELFSRTLSDESKDSLERCEGGEEGLGESVSEDSPWMWWKKKTEFIAGLLIPLFLFSIPPLSSLYSLSP